MHNKYNYGGFTSTPKKRSIIPFIIVGLISAIIGGFIAAYIAPKYLYGGLLPDPNENIIEKEEDSEEQVVSGVNIKPNDNISTVSAVAEKNMDSVVGITTIVMEKEWIFEIPTEGVGTGLIVDESGYILTNSHVVGDGRAQSISVLLGDGIQEEAELLWFDSTLDLAIIKANTHGNKPVDLGDSDELKVGEIAVAIGNPLGLEFQRSVTAGVISGLNRSIRIDQANIIEDLIQTDASINPGNSGGPLLNSSGEVIGINTAKVQSGEGLGFAIPINTVKPVIDEVIKEGSFTSVSLGIAGVGVDIYKDQFNLDLPLDSGIYVAEVVRNSPAHISGIRMGDIIKSIDGIELDSMVGLRKLLFRYRVGDVASLEINRDGQEIDVDITFR